MVLKINSKLDYSVKLKTFKPRTILIISSISLIILRLEFYMVAIY
jgi:hypothetical protein